MSDPAESTAHEVRVDSGPSVRSRLASLLADEEHVRLDELEEYVDVRYDDLQEKIREADTDYEDKLRILIWKGQQEELIRLLRHFKGDTNAR